MNNDTIRKAATEVVQNAIRLNLSPEATRAVQVMAAIFDGITPLFNAFNRELNLMALHQDAAVAKLPAGLWEKLPKNKKVLFLAEVNRAVAVVNRSQDKLGALIAEQSQVLDAIKPKELSKLLTIQSAILRAAKPVAPRTKKAKAL